MEFCDITAGCVTNLKIDFIFGLTLCSISMQSFKARGCPEQNKVGTESVSLVVLEYQIHRPDRLKGLFHPAFLASAVSWLAFVVEGQPRDGTCKDCWMKKTLKAFYFSRNRESIYMDEYNLHFPS